MTKKKSKKRLVRARMSRTGESYQTAQRAVTVTAGVAVERTAPSPPAPPQAIPTPPPLPTAEPARFVLRWKAHALALEGGPFTVGRLATCSLCVTEDVRMSRMHATFTVVGDRVEVQDHESLNGVYVNNKRVLGTARVVPGDAILIGQTALTLAAAAAPTPPVVLPDRPALGTVLAGRYKLLREVAPKRGELAGESGHPWALYHAHHVLLGADVMIKLLPKSAIGGAPLRAWLLREGRALQRAAHPQVQRVLDIGETDAGSIYLVLESVPEMTLDELLWDERLDHAMVLDIARQLARVLVHVHAKGVVHRDLCNAAIHVAEEGGRVVIKLTSFARSTIAGDPRLTPLATAVGHPGWLAPEQLRGEEGGPRSDLFAFGVVLYTMLAGRLPFEPGRASAEPRPLPLRPKAHPEPLDRICLRLLSSDPAARYPDAKALLAALDELRPSARPPALEAAI